MNPKYSPEVEAALGKVRKAYAEAERRKVAKESKEKIVEFPKRLSDAELWRRQQIIDQCWEGVLREERALRQAQEARSFHRGPGDRDWSA
jgi:hypothetical protein